MNKKPSYEALEQKIADLIQELGRLRQKENAYSQINDRFQLLYDRVPVAYQSLDETGTLIEVNPAWLNALGYDREEVIGKPFAQFLHPDWKAHFEYNFPRFKAVGEVLGVEFEMVKKDGRTIMVAFKGKIGRDGEGNFQQTHCVFEDISERKAAEDQLRQTRELLRETQELGRMGGWEMDPATFSVVWTDTLYRLWGYEPGEIQDLHLFFLEKVVHPLDRDRLELLFSQMMNERIPISAQYRAICKDGQEKIMKGEAVPETDETGRVVRVFGSHMDMTTLKKTENALKAEQTFSETMLNAVLDVIVLFDPQIGKAIRWNTAFVELSGYSEQELTHMSMVETCISPQDQDRTRTSLADVLETGSGRLEVDLLCKTGEKIPMEFSGARVENPTDGSVYVIFIGRDIRERKQVQEALEASHEQFFTVLEGIDATVYVVDIDTHEILFVNQHMADSFGRDMTGEICHKAYCNLDEQCSHCPIPQLRDKENPDRQVVVWQGKNPVTQKWYVNYDRLIRWPDGRQVKLQIATDITELKQMEAELRQAYKMESIGTLAGGVAHDFNNILGIIIGNAELALDDLPAWSPVQEYIREIKTAGLRAKDVVRQLLSFSRKTEVEQKPLDLLSVANESLKLIRSSLPSDIEIHKNFPDTVPAVMADATQIHQVMINLCTNAAHAMADQGGIMTVTLDSGTIPKVSGQETSDDFLAFSVTDTGPGIAPEVQEKMFDPYFTTKEVGKGTGMGLSVVHGIVKNHGGHIQVDSAVNQGTCITVFFPVIDGQPLPAFGEETEIMEKEAPAPKERILFVDDESAIVMLVEKSLGKLGYRVKGFTQPENALAHFTADPKAFDLVISDMTMPEMSGRQLAQKIKAISPHIPVIICSGRTEGMNMDENGDSVVDAAIMKPAPRQVLVQAIEMVMEKK